MSTTPNSPLSQAEIDLLEKMIDARQGGLFRVLAALAEVCELKAEHLREAWQDENTATVWEIAAHQVDALSESIQKKGL